MEMSCGPKPEDINQDEYECQGGKPMGRIKHIFIPINKQARTWMFKYIADSNMGGLQRMVNKGTLYMMQP